MAQTNQQKSSRLVVVIVSNRLPVTVAVESATGSLKMQRSNGGLVSGLAPLADDCEVVWVGWPGPGVPASEHVRSALGQLTPRMVPVFLDVQVEKAFYEGFSNSILWPLLHGLPSRHAVRDADGWWEAYKVANREFADVVAGVVSSSKRDETVAVWVHDYQLMLLPKMLRERLGNAGPALGHFMHVPCASSREMLALPHHCELVQSLLAADLVGWHTHEYCSCFIDCAKRSLGRAPPPSRVGAFPIQIDFDHWRAAAAKPWNRDIAEAVDGIRGRIAGGGSVVYTLSRLDPSKGILEALAAVQTLLSRDISRLRGRFLFVLVTIPSREGVTEYAQLHSEINCLVSEINGEFSDASWSPVLFVYRSLTFAETVGLYAAANVALITPLRDGMNLVCKEFVAVKSASSSAGGVLVLSRLAGAAAELHEALLVTPMSSADVVSGLQQALDMPLNEQQQRLEAMADRLRHHNVRFWNSSFISRLLGASAGSSASTRAEAETAQIAAAFSRAATPLICVECEHPPAQEKLLFLLRRLADRAEVVLLSSHSRETFGSWMRSVTRAELVAEHGSWIRHAGKDHWDPSELQDGVQAAPWQVSALQVLRDAEELLPNSHIEQRVASLTLKLGNNPAIADKGSIEGSVHVLKAALEQAIAGSSASVVLENSALTVRALEISKGAFLANKIAGRAHARLPGHDFVLTVGTGTDGGGVLLSKSHFENSASVFSVRFKEDGAAEGKAIELFEALLQ